MYFSFEHDSHVCHLDYISPEIGREYLLRKLLRKGEFYEGTIVPEKFANEIEMRRIIYDLNEEGYIVEGQRMVRGVWVLTKKIHEELLPRFIELAEEKINKTGDTA